MAFRLQLSSALGVGRRVFTKLTPVGFSAAHNTLAGMTLRASNLYRWLYCKA